MIITVIGSDNRQRELAKLFNKHYDTIYLSGNEELKVMLSIVKISDAIILPLPMTRDNQKINTTDFSISAMFDAVNENAVVFAGMCKDISCKAKIIDYNNDEEFTLKNAFYTAESAVSLSIANTPFSLKDAQILILGNGRIGKCLGKLLSPFCDNLTVSARREKDFEYIRNQGLKSINSNEISDLSGFDIVFNTIPHNVITKGTLDTIKNNALIIDLASKNSGLSDSRSSYIDAKALPAKYCPSSSAKALYDSVIRQL